MPVPLLDLKSDQEPLRAELDAALARVLSSGQYILGDEVRALENEISDFLGVPHAVGVSSGSDALVCALLSVDCGPGTEVVTSPFSFFATPEAILRVGATPRFVDIDPDDLMISPEAIERALGPRTRAVLPVHLYGHAARVDDLAGLAEARGVALVEDAAQAFGATLEGRALGTWGTLGCFSFFPTKPLGGAGDGGLVATANDELGARLRSLRVHGATARYTHREWSGNYRLDALQAAVLGVKLPHVRRWQTARTERARRYENSLQGLAAIRTLPTRETEVPCHALFTVRVIDGSRDRLADYLSERGIASAVHYPTPLYAQPALAHLGVDKNEFPNTELACKEVLSLPLFASMTVEQVDSVVKAVRTFYS